MGAPTEMQRAVRIELGRAPDDETVIPGWLIDQHYDNDGAGDRLSTAILVAESLAATAAHSFSWTADGQTMRINDRMAQWQTVANRLRRRKAAQVSEVVTTLADATEDSNEWE